LLKVFADDSLDFLVLCSSQNAIVGGAGQVAYCAANLYLDAVAQAQKRSQGIVSINWNRWQGIGMAAQVESRQERRSGFKSHDGLTVNEGTEVFHRVVAAAMVSQVVVAKRDLFQEMLLAKRLDRDCVSDGMTLRMAKPHETVEDSINQDSFSQETRLVTATARMLLGIWQTVLGFKSLKFDDNFFEVGGDSLIAIQVINQLRQHNLSVDLTVRHILEYPTIASLARFIDTHSLVMTAHTDDFIEDEI
jgi:aryl carrier-like protein